MSTELPLVAPLRKERRRPTLEGSQVRSPAPLSKVQPLRPAPSKRILDFDVEARATGYGDPDWVPQEITAIAWSWVGDDRIACQLRSWGARRMLERFRHAYDQADVITGHNIRKYDLPLLNAEMLRFGFPALGAKVAQDTLRDLVRTKGMKRDQDNLLKHFRVGQKIPLSWQDWQDAYAEKGWPVVRDRVVGDVADHKRMREVMLEQGWLKVRPEKLWRP